MERKKEISLEERKVIALEILAKNSTSIMNSLYQIERNLKVR